MKKISVVINTLNEERNLPFALESVRSWAYEIIVVDMFSDDRTVEIAQSYGASIFMYERLGFSEPARAFAISKVVGDWVLILDADELIPMSLSEKLIRLTEDDKSDVVFLPRVNYLLGDIIEYTGWGADQDRQLRFFKPSSVSVTSEIHNFMHPIENARITHLDYESYGGIVHFNYIDSEQFLEKMNRYTSIEATQFLERNSKKERQRLFFKIFIEPFRRYIVWSGYKDGWRGSFLAFYMFLYRLIVYMKVKEIQYTGNREEIISRYSSISRKITRSYSIKTTKSVKKISVVIVNWNAWRMTVDCIESLIVNTNFLNIVVVDNGSDDGSFDMLRSIYPNIKILRSATNLGFGGGNNIGIQEAMDDGSDYIWLLNNDTIVFRETLNSMMHEFDKDDRLAAISSKLYKDIECRNIQTLGAGVVNRFTGMTKELKHIRVNNLIELPVDSYLCAASMVVRVNALRQIGLFDERFFLYWEDVDLSFRLKQANWKIAISANSHVYHRESASLGKNSSRTKRYFYESAKKFYQKHIEFPIIPYLNAAIRFNLGEMLRRVSR